MENEYLFSIEKISKYKKIKMPDIICKGAFNVSRIELDESNETEYIFRFNSFEQKGLKEPLILTPFKWIIDKETKNIQIKNKTNLMAIWKRYRDRHNKPELQASFLILERLLFHTSLGFEYYSFSYSVYQPFFIPCLKDIKNDDIIESQDWLFMPMDIPLDTYYKVAKNTDQLIYLSGWVTLDKEKLDKLLLKEQFRRKAKEYHFSQDFTIDSKIDILIDKKSNRMLNAKFELEIKGKDDLSEKYSYWVKDAKLAKLERLGIDPYKNEPNKTYIIGKPKFLD